MITDRVSLSQPRLVSSKRALVERSVKSTDSFHRSDFKEDRITLDLLPNELQHLIFSHLDQDGLKAVKLSSRQLAAGARLFSTSFNPRTMGDLKDLLVLGLNPESGTVIKHLNLSNIEKKDLENTPELGNLEKLKEISIYIDDLHDPDYLKICIDIFFPSKVRQHVSKYFDYNEPQKIGLESRISLVETRRFLSFFKPKTNEDFDDILDNKLYLRPENLVEHLDLSHITNIDQEKIRKITAIESLKTIEFHVNQMRDADFFKMCTENMKGSIPLWKTLTSHWPFLSHSKLDIEKERLIKALGESKLPSETRETLNNEFNEIVSTFQRIHDSGETKEVLIALAEDLNHPVMPNEFREIVQHPVIDTQIQRAKLLLFAFSTLSNEVKMVAITMIRPKFIPSTVLRLNILNSVMGQKSLAEVQKKIMTLNFFKQFSHIEYEREDFLRSLLAHPSHEIQEKAIALITPELIRSEKKRNEIRGIALSKSSPEVLKKFLTAEALKRISSESERLDFIYSSLSRYSDEIQERVIGLITPELILSEENRDLLRGMALSESSPKVLKKLLAVRALNRSIVLKERSPEVLKNFLTVEALKRSFTEKQCFYFIASSLSHSSYEIQRRAFELIIRELIPSEKERIKLRNIALKESSPEVLKIFLTVEAFKRMSTEYERLEFLQKILTDLSPELKIPEVQSKAVGLIRPDLFYSKNTRNLIRNLVLNDPSAEVPKKVELSLIRRLRERIRPNKLRPENQIN